MRSTKALTQLLPLLLSATIVSGCAGQERTQLNFPPAADLAAATEAKPQPTDDILTSDQASEDYNASVEAWGDRLHAAGGRLCRLFEREGMKLPFKCPAPVAGDTDH